ncbi:MAG: protoheme IX farnesyltransferase [Robiginitomaculum sp.]|nr:MAG: protoheme IX farnesyltransferase [Robiginitomaculum sp.]
MTDLTNNQAVQPGVALPSDFVALLKPRVMSLVVFTALVGLVAAPGVMHPVLAMISIFAIALGGGAAGALNMWFDADIDAKMQRTCRRPIPAGRIERNDALAFGLFLSFVSVLLLGAAANYFAALFLAFTIFFYVVIYSMGLKRRTPQNIVIGGAAGAFPPMIGWAAATGSFDANALLLFAIIFLWTPPHFWALALYKRSDYAAAGIPMMPVVKGAASTRVQILVYALLVTTLGVVPVFTGLGGALYGAVSLLSGGLFLFLAVRVFLSRAGDDPGPGQAELYQVKKGDRAARDLFAFSIMYLFILFGALLVEHGTGNHSPLPIAFLQGLI